MLFPTPPKNKISIMMSSFHNNESLQGWQTTLEFLEKLSKMKIDTSEFWLVNIW